MICVFLGAGFSVAGNVPLASQLFDQVLEVDVLTRQRLIERVLLEWERWSRKHHGTPEQYLADLERQGGQQWRNAVWYVALAVALRMGNIEHVGANLKIVRHNLDRTTCIQSHEQFWEVLFRSDRDVTVLTTNYDVLAERGIRVAPRPRIRRPGFHYGFGREQLAGGGYPSYAHIQKIWIEGSVPLLKLHGSVSWSVRDGALVRYHDCRPAIRGDAAIVAPVTEKMVPELLSPIWQQAGAALSASPLWIVVGYSFPAYDMAINNLFLQHSKHGPSVHLLNPDSTVGGRVRRLLPNCSVYSHPGLPEGLEKLDEILPPNQTLS